MNDMKKKFCEAKVQNLEAKIKVLDQIQMDLVKEKAHLQCEITTEAKDSVEFIVITEASGEPYDSEFGVLVNGVPHLYYKDHEPIVGDETWKWRRVSKREFGESIRSK